jgi:hypothetical protein
MKASLHRLLALAVSVAALFVVGAVAASSALASAVPPSIHGRGVLVPFARPGALTTGGFWWVGLALLALVIAVGVISSWSYWRRDVSGTAASVVELPSDSSATESESKDKKAA